MPAGRTQAETHAGRGRLDGEGREDVGEQVDPEELDGRQRTGGGEPQRAERDEDLAEVWW
jgi:hypothetical protein